ncbi:MAG TPA: hypothetical protein VN442_02570 [Bryobacteraceae bacterium]|nr:hypothetical protein [Bryobacteraceae bacterium]
MLRRFLLALSLISCLGPLQGATLERLSLDDMIEKSTAIVRGTISGRWSAMSGGTVYTNYRVQVTERWKGPAADTAEFRIPGGRANGVRQICSGAPEPVEGKEYVLFLWTSRGGATYIIGFTQGLFELAAAGGSERIAVRALTSETVLEPGTGKAVQSERIEMRLRDLSTRISSNLSRGVKQ